MLSGDAAHFHLICHHLAQIGNADLGHLAGKGGRYGKVAEKPAVDSEALLAEVQEELATYKQLLRRETAASQRYHGKVTELKERLKARAEPDPAAGHHAKQLREAHERSDELQGQLQGAERKLKEKDGECRTWKAKAQKFDAEVKEAHDANAGLRWNYRARRKTQVRRRSCCAIDHIAMYVAVTCTPIRITCSLPRMLQLPGPKPRFRARRSLVMCCAQADARRGGECCMFVG